MKKKFTPLMLLLAALLLPVMITAQLDEVPGIPGPGDLGEPEEQPWAAGIEIRVFPANLPNGGHVNPTSLGFAYPLGTPITTHYICRIRPVMPTIDLGFFTMTNYDAVLRIDDIVFGEPHFFNFSFPNGMDRYLKYGEYLDIRIDIETNEFLGFWQSGINIYSNATNIPEYALRLAHYTFILRSQDEATVTSANDPMIVGEEAIRTARLSQPPASASAPLYHPEITLFPTLVNDRATLRFAKVTAFAQSYRVIDANGRVVESGSTAPYASEAVLDLAHLAPGPYFIRVEGRRKPLRILKR